LRPDDLSLKIEHRDSDRYWYRAQSTETATGTGTEHRDSDRYWYGAQRQRQVPVLVRSTETATGTGTEHRDSDRYWYGAALLQ
jgi:hypothetical protein